MKREPTENQKAAAAQQAKDKAGEDKRKELRAQAASKPSKSNSAEGREMQKLAATIGAHGPNATAIGTLVDRLDKLDVRYDQLEATLDALTAPPEAKPKK